MAERDVELERVLAGYLEAVDRGEPVDRERLVAEYPELAGEIGEFLHDERDLNRFVRSGVTRRLFSSPGSTVPGSERDTASFLAPGTRLGDYHLEGVLGRGGMGTVYRATHERLRRPIALKILPPRLSGSAEFVHRFEREGRALARLTHPNIVQIHDMGVIGDLYYIAMERVDGVDLRTLLRQRRLEPEQALAIVPRICDALEYAHRQGVVHRDIKPENILLTRDGEPKIADFGLARLVEGETPHSDVTLTRTDMLIGTRSYMAPEQWKSAQVDHRADIYALGLVLYEMLVGELPVGPFHPPSERTPVDLRIDQVVRRALEQDPGQRYQHASEMGSDVSNVLDNPLNAAQPLVLIDANKGKRLATCTERRLRITTKGWAEWLKIRGWKQAEVAVEGQQKEVRAWTDNVKDPRVTPDRPIEGGMEVRLQGWRLTVYVPENVQVEVHVTGMPCEMFGVRGAVSFWPTGTNVTVHQHRGRLSVERTGSGWVRVHGIETSHLELNAERGPVRVTDLVLNGGRASLESAQGAVQCYFVRERCSFDYDVRAASGHLELGERLRDGASGESQHRRGRVGLGGASLLVRSQTGDVVLDDRSDPPPLQVGYRARHTLTQWWPLLGLLALTPVLLRRDVRLFGVPALAVLIAVISVVVWTQIHRDRQ